MGCATSHRLKWCPFPPNEVGRIAQHVRRGEGGIQERTGVEWDPIIGAVDRFSSICLTAEENSGKLQKKSRLMMAVRTAIISKDLCRIAYYVRQKRKEETVIIQ